MKGVVVQNGFAFVYLSKDFYLKNNILKTIDVYKEFLESAISEISDKYYILKFTLKSKDYTLEKTIDEFLNYLLSLEYEK